jgi:hypothetical protein
MQKDGSKPNVSVEENIPTEAQSQSEITEQTQDGKKPNESAHDVGIEVEGDSKAQNPVSGEEAPVEERTMAESAPVETVDIEAGGVNSKDVESDPILLTDSQCLEDPTSGPGDEEIIVEEIIEEIPTEVNIPDQVDTVTEVEGTKGDGPIEASTDKKEAKPTA